MILAGSKFPQTGMFEVTKADDEPIPTNSSSGSPPQSPTVSTPAQQSALRVTIPTELQGVAYIMVLCRKGNYFVASRRYYYRYLTI